MNFSREGRSETVCEGSFGGVCGGDGGNRPDDEDVRSH
jgi:hypothetical protein